jgi:hypothetical protein
VHLIDGAAIRAFHELGTQDRLELTLLPVRFGDGIPLLPPDAVECHCDTRGALNIGHLTDVSHCKLHQYL